MKCNFNIPLSLRELTPQIIGKLSVYLSEHSRLELAALGIHKDDEVLALVAMAHTADYAYAIMQDDCPLVMMGADRDPDDEGKWTTWFMFTDLFYERGREATKIVNDVLQRGIAMESPDLIRVHSYCPDDKAIKWFRRLGFVPTDAEGEGLRWTVLEYQFNKKGQ